MTTTAIRKAQIFGRATDATLLDSLRMLDLLPSLTEPERMTYAWVCDELERRNPQVNAYLDAAYDEFGDSTDGRTYGEILAAGIAAQS